MGKTLKNTHFVTERHGHPITGRHIGRSLRAKSLKNAHLGRATHTVIPAETPSFSVGSNLCVRPHHRSFPMAPLFLFCVISIKIWLTLMTRNDFFVKITTYSFKKGGQQCIQTQKNLQKLYYWDYFY